MVEGFVPSCLPPVHLFRRQGQFPFLDQFRHLDSKVEWLAVHYYRCYMIVYWHYDSQMLVRLASL